MSQESSDNPLTRTGARQFFFVYFFADWLEDQTNVIDAVNDYLRSETLKDPGGRRLLSDIDGLLSVDKNEPELRSLIEKEWGANADAESFGISYKDTLVQIRDYLLAQP